MSLVDIDLGEENGVDVARALAACDEPVPVIMISVYGRHQIQAERSENSPVLGFDPVGRLSPGHR